MKESTEAQKRELQHTANDLIRQIEEVEKVEQSSDGDNEKGIKIGDIESSEIVIGTGAQVIVDALERQVVEVEKQVEKLLTTPIEMPPDSVLAVKMVPIHMLEQLERNRADENRMGSFAGVSFGAVMGVVLNWATGSEINGMGILAVVLLLLATGVFFWEMRRSGKRAKENREKMLNW